LLSANDFTERFFAHVTFCELRQTLWFVLTGRQSLFTDDSAAVIEEHNTGRSEIAFCIQNCPGAAIGIEVGDSGVRCPQIDPDRGVI